MQGFGAAAWQRVQGSGAGGGDEEGSVDFESLRRAFEVFWERGRPMVGDPGARGWNVTDSGAAQVGAWTDGQRVCRPHNSAVHENDLRDQS